MPTLLHYLIVCPLVFLAGFVDSIAGGGGLISLPAYMITGLPVHYCIGTNKMSACMGTCLATARYAKAGYVDWKIALPPIITALGGAAIGTNIAARISDDVFRIVILIILPLTAIYVLCKKDAFPEEDRLGVTQGHQMMIAAAVAFVIGIYDGFYGPGTGTFLLLLLTRFAGMGLRRANGLTKVINLCSNISSLTVWLISGNVFLVLGLTAGAFSLLGNYVGSGMFKSKGASICKPIILVVLCVFLVKTILQLFGIG